MKAQNKGLSFEQLVLRGRGCRGGPAWPLTAGAAHGGDAQRGDRGTAPRSAPPGGLGFVGQWVRDAGVLSDIASSAREWGKSRVGS